MKLYELSQDYQQVMALLDEGTEVEVFDTLESIKTEIAEKATSIAIVMKSYDSNIEILDAEIKRLQERKRSEQSKQQWLKDYLKFNMEQAQIDKLKTATHTISIRKNPPKLVIENESLIPSEYTIVIPERYEIDKASVKTALKTKDVPGAKLEQGTSLMIK